MTEFKIQEGTVFEDFEDVTEWTAAGGTIANDTTIFKTGAKSLKLTSGVGTNCLATKTISIDMSRAGVISYWVYIENAADVSSLQVIISPTTDFSAYFTKTINQVHEGWNKMVIAKTDWAVSGSPDWASTMVRVRVRVNANTSLAPVVYFDSFRYQEYSRPKFVFSFDDGWASQYDECYEYMRKYGFKGTMYVIPTRIDTADYMTLANLQTLFAAGWDICTHGDINLTTLASQAAVQEEVVATMEYIISNNLSRNDSEKHIAYPNGGYDGTVLAAMENLRMQTGRAIIERLQATALDNNLLLTRDLIRHTDDAADAEDMIDLAIASGQTLMLNIHKIVETPTVSTEMSIAAFQGMCDYLSRRREEIDAVTMTEWYRGMTISRELV